jgi:hypothetical protein
MQEVSVADTSSHDIDAGLDWLSRTLEHLNTPPKAHAAWKTSEYRRVMEKLGQHGLVTYWNDSISSWDIVHEGSASW